MTQKKKLSHLDKIIHFHNKLSRAPYRLYKKEFLAEYPMGDSTLYRLRKKIEELAECKIINTKIENDSYYMYDTDDTLPTLLSKKSIPGSDAITLARMVHIFEEVSEGVVKDSYYAFIDNVKRALDLDNTLPLSVNKIKIVPLIHRKTKSGVIDKLVQSIDEDTRVTITYNPKHISQSETVREISVQKIILYRDKWYVDAKCHLRDGLRTFNVSDITKAERCRKKREEISFNESSVFYRDSYGIFNGKAKEKAKIRFTGTAAHFVAQEHWHTKAQKKYLPNGDLVLTVPYNRPEELIMDILKWGDMAYVEKPESLRLAIVEKVNRLQELYSTENS